MSEEKIPTYVCREATGEIEVNLVEWDDGKEHDSKYRKIEFKFETKLPSPEFLEEGECIKEGKSIFTLSSATDLEKFAEACKAKKTDEIMAAISDLDNENFIEKVDDDVITNFIYIEDKEAVFIITGKDGTLIDAWRFDGEILKTFESEIYKLNSMLALGLK